jgi:hypothetical protein
MGKHIEINVEEILVDSSVDGYRVDGFRILARMIARKYMSDRQAQATTIENTSRPKDINGGKPENDDN